MKATSTNNSTSTSAKAYDARKLGLGSHSHAAVELAANDPVKAVEEGSEAVRKQNTARYHSVLAMEAARKMRRTRQKKKTGQEVCHHLKMMLTSEPVVDAPIAEARAGQIHLGF